MALLVYNKSASDEVLAGGVGLTVPASLYPPFPGTPVNVTAELNGASPAVFAALEAQRISSSLAYVWTAIPEFNIESLTVISFYTSTFIDQGSPTDVGSAWPVRVTDGSSVASVADDDPVGTEPALVVRNIPSGTQEVSLSSVPLATDAATESTLATIAKEAQLPSALVGGRLDTNQGSWMGSTAPTVGQKAMVSSLPVVISNDQSSLATTVGNGAGLSAVNIQDGGNSLTVDDGGSSVTIDDGGSTITVDGLVSIQDGGNSITVDDGSSSITVDDGGSSITVDGLVSIQDGGNSITVDDGGVSVTVDGLVSIQDGGNSITVDGLVSIQDGGNSITVDDGSSSITVDDGGGSITVDGLVSIQDGGNSITVDDGGGSVTIDGAVTQGSPATLANAWLFYNAADLPVKGGKDPFGRLRVSSPQTIFDSKQIYTNQPLFWDDSQTSGSGTSSTHDPNRASTAMAVANLTAGTRVRQTYRWFNYQPGKGQLILMTFVMGAAATGITRRVGYFETNNGVFLEQISSGLGVVIRSFASGVVADTRVAQASWNIDVMNGSGISGKTLDITKAQILIIDFEWLGSGTVRFGFIIDGEICYVHQFRNANALSVVYMSTPNLPLRYEISNSGTGPIASLEHICASVASEGGRTVGGVNFSIDRGFTPMVTADADTIYPLISIRLKSTAPGALIIPGAITVVCTTTSAYRWSLVVNPTVTGSMVFTGVTNSAVEANVSTLNTTTVTGGTVIASGYGFSQTEGIVYVNAPDFALGTSISGTRDILVLTVQRVTGAGETFYGSLGWQEIE